jgi:hypothetical protein
VSRPNTTFRHNPRFFTNRRFGFGFGYGGFGPYGYGFGPYGYDFGPFDDGSGAPLFVLPSFSGPSYPRWTLPNPALTTELPARLTVRYPPTSRVWLDGKWVPLEAAGEYILFSPALKSGEQYTFTVKLRWSQDGKTYEANRSITLGWGDRSRLSIVSGDEVKE